MILVLAAYVPTIIKFYNVHQIFIVLLLHIYIFHYIIVKQKDCLFHRVVSFVNMSTSAGLLRRNARLRKEYLYRKSLEGKEKELYEKKRKIKQALEGSNASTSCMRMCLLFTALSM